MMRRSFAFIKKNTVSAVSALLAVVMLVSGIVSYARFISKSNYEGNSGVGFFSYSASIDGISALSFTNTAFWGGSVDGEQSEENLVAMNAIRTIDFSINNFEGDVVNSVKTSYSMTFTVPRIFGESLAFQIIDDDGSPMIPQIVMPDILSKSEYSTADCTDYNGEMYVGAVLDKNGNEVEADSVNGNDLYFTVSKSTVNSMTAYTATAATPDGNVIIDISPRLETKEQILNFRLWNIGGIVDSNPGFNSEGGELLSPLTMVIEEEQVYYDITVTTPEFILPAGVKTTNNHTMRLVPTTVVDDIHLGGIITDKTTDEAAETIYSGQQMLLKSVHENVKIYSDEGKTTLLSDVTEPVFGSVKVYNTGNVSTVKTVSPAIKVTLDPESYSESDWTVLQDWNEISREGTATDYTANMQKTEKKTLVYILYEQTTVSNHIITTQVLSTSAANASGHQLNISLKESTETTTVVEKRPISTLTVTQIRESTRTDTYTGGALSSTGATTVGDPYNDSEEEAVQIPDGINTTIQTSSPVTKVVYKDLSRVYESVEVTAKSVSYTPINPDGTFGETTYFTSTSPFSIYSDSLRKYFVSQCFSKSYPLSVNVTFEQRSKND